MYNFFKNHPSSNDFKTRFRYPPMTAYKETIQENSTPIPVLFAQTLYNKIIHIEIKTYTKDNISLSGHPVSVTLLLNWFNDWKLENGFKFETNSRRLITDFKIYNLPISNSIHTEKGSIVLIDSHKLIDMFPTIVYTFQ